MYKLADKKEIIKLFREGYTVSEIRLTSNISKSTLYRWKSEYDAISRIGKSLKKGNFENAKQLIEEFKNTCKKSNALFIAKVVKRLIAYDYFDYAKELAEESLLKNPNDLALISELTIIAKKQGNWNEIKRLCYKRLELDPDNLPARKQLIVVEKEKGNWNEVERLCNEILQLEPDDKIAEQQLRNARKNKKNMTKSMSKNDNFTVANKKRLEDKIRIVRRQIHSGKFTLDDVVARQKEMEEIGIDEMHRNLLLAEAYERQNMPNQTRTFLKKALSQTEDPKMQKSIKGLISAAQAKVKKPSHINPWDNICIQLSSAKTQSKLPEER